MPPVRRYDMSDFERSIILLLPMCRGVEGFSERVR
jgi:hypothetical protein